MPGKEHVMLELKLLHRSSFYSELDYSSGDLRLRASEFMSWLVCREVKEAWDRSTDFGLYFWTVAQYAQHHPSGIHPGIQVELPSYHSHQLKLQWPNTPVLCKAFSCYNPENKGSFWEHYFTKFLCCLVWGLFFFLIGIQNYFYFYVPYPIFCSILFHNNCLFQLLARATSINQTAAMREGSINTGSKSYLWNKTHSNHGIRIMLTIRCMLTFHTHNVLVPHFGLYLHLLSGALLASWLSQGASMYLDISSCWS